MKKIIIATIFIGILSACSNKALIDNRANIENPLQPIPQVQIDRNNEVVNMDESHTIENSHSNKEVIDTPNPNTKKIERKSKGSSLLSNPELGVIENKPWLKKKEPSYRYPIINYSGK